MADSIANDLPEFRVVVKHRNRRGPLGPYRLVLSVAFALLIAGEDLLDAATTGVGTDAALIRATLAAWFVWILAGLVSRILAAGEQRATRTTPTADVADPGDVHEPDPVDTSD